MPGLGKILERADDRHYSNHLIPRAIDEPVSALSDQDCTVLRRHVWHQPTNSRKTLQNLDCAESLLFEQGGFLRSFVSQELAVMK